VANAIISIAITTFCLSTQIGFFIYFKTAVTDLVGERIFDVVKWLYFIPGIIFAGITNVDQLWKLANISVALSAIPNLIALLFLSGVFIKLMRDYFSEQRKFDTELIDRTRNYIKIS